MRQPFLAVSVLEPALIQLMLRILNALKFVQKDFEISWSDNKLFDVMDYRVILLANVLGDSQFPRCGSSRPDTSRSGAPRG